MKIEKDINKELLVMKKNDETSEALYTRLRSTGAQPANLYGLAKVHKQGTPLRPVLSLPDSSYDNLKKHWQNTFMKLRGHTQKRTSNGQEDLGEN